MFLRLTTLGSSIDEALRCQLTSRRFKYPHAFKYMEAKYANELVNEGKLRIGTLRDYRSREKFCGGRLDEDEGTSSRSVTLNASCNEDIPDFAKFAVQFAPGVKNGRISNFRVTQPWGVDNAYVFCVSKHYAPAELLPDFAPADACVEIINPIEFYRALEDSMAEHGRSMGIHDCNYAGRKIEYPAPAVDPFVAKDPRYAHQAEVRVGWQPREPLTSTFIDIVNPKLRNYCRRIL